jgi:hypothetical protein
MKMLKTFRILLPISVAATSSFSQGYINFSWSGTGTQGIQIGSPSSPSSQLPGWYLSGDYSVQAYMAVGANNQISGLVPIAAAKTIFLGGATTTASGSPGTDGSGLWSAGPVDTGLPIGPATIQVRAWYDPNHNTTYPPIGVNFGASDLYNITLVAHGDPTINSLDTISMAPFKVSYIPEPSSFALGVLGVATVFALRRYRRRR